MGLFTELVNEIKQLDRWLAPVETDPARANDRGVSRKNPRANELEVRLRVAIRESIGMTRDEERNALVFPDHSEVGLRAGRKRPAAVATAHQDSEHDCTAAFLFIGTGT